MSSTEVRCSGALPSVSWVRSLDGELRSCILNRVRDGGRTSQRGMFWTHQLLLPALTGKEGTGPGMWAPFYAGKGVEIRFSPLYLLEGMKACSHGATSPLITHVHAKSLQSCPTLCDPMDCSPPGSSVPEILQARMLDRVAVPSSGGSSQPRDRTHCFLCLRHWQVGSLPLVPLGKR